MKEFISKNPETSLSKLLNTFIEIKEEEIKIPVLFKGGKDLTIDILFYEPSEIAKQLIYVEHLYQKSIRTEELVFADWDLQKKHEKKSPNVIKYVKYADKVSFWISTEVLTANESERSDIITLFLEVANVALSLNSFATAMQIYVGLFKFKDLKKTWKEIKFEHIIIFDKMEKLFHYENCFKTYRETFGEIYEKNGHCLPKMSLVIRDMTIIDAVNEDFIKEKNNSSLKLINVPKLELYGKVIGPIKEMISFEVEKPLQKETNNFKKIFILDYLKTAEYWTEFEINRVLREFQKKEKSPIIDSKSRDNEVNLLSSFLDFRESTEYVVDNMDERNWDLIFAAGETREFLEDEILLNKFENNRLLFRIINGTAEILVQIEEKEISVILEPSNIFGEMCLFPEFDIRYCKAQVKGKIFPCKKLN